MNFCLLSAPRTRCHINKANKPIGNLDEYLPTRVDAPTVKYLKSLYEETLTYEEALLLARYIRSEKGTQIPRTWVFQQYFILLFVYITTQMNKTSHYLFAVLARYVFTSSAKEASLPMQPYRLPIVNKKIADIKDCSSVVCSNSQLVQQ